jgi:hypothetical protein
MLRFTADSWKKTPVFFVFLKWTAGAICEPGYDEMRSREISCTIRKTPKKRKSSDKPSKKLKIDSFHVFGNSTRPVVSIYPFIFEVPPF